MLLIKGGKEHNMLLRIHAIIEMLRKLLAQIVTLNVLVKQIMN
mgnify:CR=1 FL=1